ncbi:MAG: iron-containing alcohol dehydrogenase [Glaciecola sp.]
MTAQILLPRILEIGDGASLQVATVLISLGFNKPLIITDNTMVKLGYVGPIQDCLHAENISSKVFSNTEPEPTVASIEAAVHMATSDNFDCIIALGGGSPIDSAKAVSILAKFGGQMHEYKFPRIVNEAGLPIIAIPTTAGTGSEVTKFTIITNQDTDEKMLCVGKGFMPVAALVDYSLTLSLPARTTADTGIDALTHAIESYVSKKANPYSKSQSIAAIKLLAPNLRTVYEEPSNQKAREAMMLGATLAGIAFSNASVALVHGMSRPIGAFFHVPHGLSNAMLLPSVTQYSIAGAVSLYADCARAMGIASTSDSDDDANHALIAELYALNHDLSVPTLAEFGVDKAYFDSVVHTMAEQALASGSPSNNPITPSVTDMVNIYERLWN